MRLGNEATLAASATTPDEDAVDRLQIACDDIGVVEVSLGEAYVGVRWLEQHGKDAMRYAFRRTEDRLFLSER
jgi:hypothetical protein